MDPQAGARVSHYQLIRKLGSGGMGDVYLADDLQLGRAVAIKFLNAPTDVRARQRLLNEARAVASLDHPVICGVHEVGSDPVRGDFIVMQYVEGDTLAAAIARGPLPREQALAIAADIADALAVAHRHGIVHRDLKPQNIVLQPSGRAKLLDFGIAKRVTSEQQDADADTHTPLTRPHAMIGTPSYMSPEQVKGERADGRSDLFSLGCVLYECLTGRRAFTGGTSGEVYGRILHTDPPPISSLTDRVEPDLEALVTRLLRKSPGDRFQTASEVVGAIATLRGRSNSSDSGYRITPRPPRTAPRSFFVVAAALLVVVAAVGIWWRSGALPKPPDDARGFYERGVDALHDGAYDSARQNFERATGLFDAYAFAHSRLAEAHSLRDNESAAQAALSRASALGDRWLLPRIERLRLEAVRSIVRRDHAAALASYAKLVDEQPADAKLLVDAGRAEDAAGHIGRAITLFEKAIESVPDFAAAHMRLGSAQGLFGHTKKGLSSLEQAVRLYRAASRIEGEAEALVRLGMLQINDSDLEAARASAEQATAITSDARYLSQRLRARFLLARIEVLQGRPTDAAQIASDAINQARDAGLNLDAAVGLVDLANAYIGRQLYDDADRALVSSIDLAAKHGARHAEMRARLQQASLRLQTGKYGEAIELAEAPFQFAVGGNYGNLAAQARNIRSRAREYQGAYDEAEKLAKEALAFARSNGSPVLIAESLENIAGQLTAMGRLPEALAAREEREQINSEGNLHGSLKFDIPNRAELLLRLNRTDDARKAIDLLKERMASGLPAYGDRAARITQLEALLAAVENRHQDLEVHATALSAEGSVKPDDSATFFRIVREYGRVKSGRPQTKPETVVAWLESITGSMRREAAYWAGQTLLAMRVPELAAPILTPVLEQPYVQHNPELRWRLAALCSLALRSGTTPDRAKEYESLSKREAQRVNATWGGHATTYFARADLAVLR